MKRRSFLKKAASWMAVPIIPFRTYQEFGWILNHKDIHQSLYDVSNLRNFGRSKVACLWKAYSAVRDQEWIAHQQVGGDCVAHGGGSGLDLLTCCRIALEHKSEKYVNDSSTDMIYSGGRNLIARSKGRAGMIGYWAVEYLKQYGNLLRIKYPPYDLRPYNKETLKHWERNGIPESLQIKAKEHSLLNYIPVQSWEEVRDSVSSGHPVIFCASLGANNDKRDKDGFIRPSGRWAHAWTLAGVQDGKRPGACLINSHGASFGSGPKTHSQPDGSVWVDAKYIDWQVRNFGDSYALADYKGFSIPDRRYIIW